MLSIESTGRDVMESLFLFIKRSSRFLQLSALECLCGSCCACTFFLPLIIFVSCLVFFLCFVPLLNAWRARNFRFVVFFNSKIDLWKYTIHKLTKLLLFLSIKSECDPNHLGWHQNMFISSAFPSILQRKNRA